MRKNRNAFFAESNASYGGFNPNAAMPFSANGSSSFYASGPGPMMPNMMMGSNNNLDDIQERLAKIERNINRLDHRISAIEGNVTKTTEDFESTTNNMYII